MLKTSRKNMWNNVMENMMHQIFKKQKKMNFLLKYKSL